ncbi:MAG: class I SAM-dependent methyltransferase [Parachlamydiales bacterium]|nr:class I SAM-dependent methyltransferase [Parachlamydiales bacterium]
MICISQNFFCQNSLWEGDRIQQYFKNSELQRQWASAFFAKIAFKPSNRVLDFGCGDGKITAQFSNQVPQGHVTGIDLSCDMIKFAKRKFNQVAYTNLTFVSTDILSWQLEQHFDVIFSSCALQLVDDPLAIFVKFNEILKPQGKLFFCIPGKGNFNFIKLFKT